MEEEEEEEIIQPQSKEEKIAQLKLKKSAKTEQLNDLKIKWWGVLIAFTFGAFIVWLVLTISVELLPERYVYILTSFGGLLGIVSYSYYIFVVRSQIKRSNQNIDYKLLHLGVESLKEDTSENFFTKLVRINFKYIDQYYLQTQEQADKSFILASFAAVIGYIVIIVGIVLMFIDKTKSAYIATGSGIISEFISAVFFYLYNKTIQKMSTYHQKLVLTQNISLAMKITEEMDKDQKAKSLEVLIDRLTTDINKYLAETKE